VINYELHEATQECFAAYNAPYFRIM